MFRLACKGFHFIPEIGEEVLVGFERQNAEKPYVAGMHYNGKEKSGYATPNNDLKVIKTRSGIETLSNDAEGSWRQSTPDGNFLHFDGQGNAVLNVPNDLLVQVGGNLNINVGKNVSFLVGLKAIYNIGMQMLMNTPILKYFIADNYHLQSPKTLINGDGEIKIEAKETNVAGTQKLFLHSDEAATINSKGIAEVKGEQGNINTNTPVNYETTKEEIKAKCLVMFRPHDKWSGEFGFDWIRVGDNDTGRRGDKYWYRDIIGKYRDSAEKLLQIYKHGIFKQDTNEYTKLMREYTKEKEKFLG